MLGFACCRMSSTSSSPTNIPWRAVLTPTGSSSISAIESRKVTRRRSSACKYHGGFELRSRIPDAIVCLLARRSRGSCPPPGGVLLEGYASRQLVLRRLSARGSCPSRVRRRKRRRCERALGRGRASCRRNTGCGSEEACRRRPAVAEVVLMTICERRTAKGEISMIWLYESLGPWNVGTP